jgi:hypothetical protein
MHGEVVRKLEKNKNKVLVRKSNHGLGLIDWGGVRVRATS